GEAVPAPAGPGRLLVGHEPTRGGDDGDARPGEYPGQVVLLRVHAQARLGQPLEPGNRALTRRPVLERDDQVLADLGVADFEAADVALLLEDLREVNLDLGIRHAHRFLVCRIGIAQTGQHVCDRVRHRHGLMALLTAVSPAGPSAWSVGAGGAQFGRRARGARAPGLVWWPFWLPAGFCDATQFAAGGQVPEADPAQPEPPVHRARPPAARAPGVGAHRELGLPLRLGDQRLLRHWVSSP